MKIINKNHSLILRHFAFLLAIVLLSGLLSGCKIDLSVNVDGTYVGRVWLPYYSSEFSKTSSLQLLSLASGHTAENTEKLLGTSGFTVLAQEHYDKDSSDPSHTAAYTVAKGTVNRGGAYRTAILIVIRGTDGGEWYSNFDYAPSHSSDALFADNFLFAAEDIFLGSYEYIDAEYDPVIIIAGHSRGGACANLLGVLMNDAYGSDNVYTYTFATPATIRSTDVVKDGSNIFNLINPLDIVPKLPFAEWGYMRAGTDIILPVTDAEYEEALNGYVSALCSVSPDIESYYYDRHSLTEAGLSDEGLSSFDLMILFGNYLTELTESLGNGSICEESPDESDGQVSGETEESDGAFNIASDDTDSFISDDSDFAPIIKIFREVSANEGEIAMRMLEEHLATAYEQLIKQY